MEVRLSRRKILIVDDDLSVSAVVKIALEAMYDVATANSALRAIQYLSVRKVDLVILDINMPGMNGIEALEKIKKGHPDIIVIMLTSYASKENMQKATSFGAYGFIFKPFDLHILRNYIYTAFNIREKDSVSDKVPVRKTVLQ
jgi:DNA-binding NtrC family response regulator